jgi:hypothetical protein
VTAVPPKSTHTLSDGSWFNVFCKRSSEVIGLPIPYGIWG